MRLISLSLEQFRSYEKLALRFGGEDLHILMGPNAAGKTNLLEAVALLSFGRSCLGGEEDDLMGWGRDHYRVRAEVRADFGEEKVIEVVSQRSPRRQRVGFLNDVRVPMGKLVGALPAVLFLPQDLALFTGPPQRRRDLLNDLLSQVSPEFAASLQRYKKVLKQRNALLRKIGEGMGRETDLLVWDEALAREGAVITLGHLELMEVLQCTLEEELRSLGETWEGVRLVYDRSPSTSSGSSPLGSVYPEQSRGARGYDGRATTNDGIEQELLRDLTHFRERDLQILATTVGPHRSDWRIEVEGRPLETFASRGQQRTAVVALLFLQVSYVEVRRGEKPIVLLDDVFSELDAAHQERLIQSLGGHQVFITATHVVHGMERGCIWNVGEGEVRTSDIGHRTMGISGVPSSFPKSAVRRPKSSL